MLLYLGVYILSVLPLAFRSLSFYLNRYHYVFCSNLFWLWLPGLFIEIPQPIRKSQSQSHAAMYDMCQHIVLSTCKALNDLVFHDRVLKESWIFFPKLEVDKSFANGSSLL